MHPLSEKASNHGGLRGVLSLEGYEKKESTLIQCNKGCALPKPHSIRLFEKDQSEVLFFCPLAGEQILKNWVRVAADFAYGINDSFGVSLQGLML